MGTEKTLSAGSLSSPALGAYRSARISESQNTDCQPYLYISTITPANILTGGFREKIVISYSGPGNSVRIGVGCAESINLLGKVAAEWGTGEFDLADAVCYP